MTLKSVLYFFLGASGYVLHVLCLRHHDNREALPNSIKDDGYYHVCHGDRSDRVLPVTDILWRPRSPAQVDSLGHDPLRRERVHLLDTPLYLRRTADSSERDAVQRRWAWRRGLRTQQHVSDTGESLQVPGKEQHVGRVSAAVITLLQVILFYF